MIILHRKRLILITSLLCMSLTIFMIKDSLENNQVVETVNLPVSNKVIVLDAGHRNPR